MTKEPPVSNDSIACVAKKRADEEEKANDIAEVLEVRGNRSHGWVGAGAASMHYVF